MDASDQTTADDESVSTDTDHRFGGVSCHQAGVEVLATPEEGARFTVDALDDKPPVVDVGYHSDSVSARAILGPEEARALADRLVTAAEDVEAARIDD